MFSIILPVFFKDLNEPFIDYEALGIEPSKKSMSTLPIKDVYLGFNEYAILPYVDEINGKLLSEVLIMNENFISPLSQKEVMDLIVNSKTVVCK